MSICKRFSDVDGCIDTLKVSVWDKGLRGNASFHASGPGGEAYITVDIHEFKDWFDESYASAFPSHASSVAYIVMGREGSGPAYDITTRPLATFTTLEGARVYSAQVTGQDCWINVIPLNPETKEQE